MKPTEITYELLRKYNVQGPRYTSYPPAPSWKNDFGPTEYEAVIIESNAASPAAPLSLYFHLPFCEKLCTFCGCTTFITGKNRSFERPYFNAVYRELDWLASRLDRTLPVVQLHLGGGTPTYSQPKDLEDLILKVRSLFRIE